MVAILYPRRLRNLLDVTQPQGTGLPDQGVPLLFSSNSSFVIETVAGGGGGSFSLGASNLGNTLGQTGVTGTRVVLAGIGNLTLSQLTDANGGTISISGGTAAGAGFSAGVSGGNTAGDTGATGTRLVLAGGQSITLSQATDVNGGTVTISGASTSQSVQTQSRFNLTLDGNTAGALALVSSGVLTLAGGNSITLSQNGNAITISGPTTSQSVQPETQTFLGGIIASNTTYTSGSVRFTGVGGGVTVSSNTGQRVDISVAAPVAQTEQTQSRFNLTISGNTAGAGALISSGVLTLAGGNNITVSQAGNALTISGANVGGAQTGISALANSETTYTSGSVTFSALGAITIRSTTGQHFQFSVNSQTAESQSFGMSNIGNTSGTTGIASGAQVRFLLAGGNNVTLSQSLNGASGTITISAASQSAESQSIGMSNIGNTSGTTGIASGAQVRFLFAGGNNITLSQSLNGASGTITISGPNTAAQSVQTLGMYAVQNTTGQSSSTTMDARTLSVAGDGAVSVGYSAGSLRISAPVQTVESQSIGMSNVGNTSGTTGMASGGQVRFVFAGGNNITLSQSLNGASGTITISAPNLGAGAMSAGVSNLGNTAGSTGVTGTQLVLVGSGVMSLSQSTGANGGTVSILAPATSVLSAVAPLSTSTNGSTISFLGPAQLSVGFSTQGNTAGDTGLVTGRVLLVGSNNITLSGSTNAGSQTISILGGAGGAGFSAGVSTGGNTAGATGVTGTQLVLVGTNAISLSQTTGANGGTVSIDAPATSSLVGVSGISISTNGSTISVMQTSNGPGYLESWFPHSVGPHTFGQQGQGTLHMQPMPLPTDIRLDRILLPTVVSNATNSSNSISISQYVGIYTRNASTLSLLTSQSTATNFSGSGTVGSYSLYGGSRWQSMGLTTTLSSGDYWMAIVMRSTTGGGAGHSVSQVLKTQLSNATFSGWSGVLGQATGASMQFQKGLGTFTATTNGLPSAVPFASLTGTGTLVMMPPIYALVSGTV